MAQTYDRVKESLVALLRDQDHKVIALTGKWGTGKTHLWDCVSKEQFGKKAPSEKPIYVSLFGVRTINELKLRILQNTYLKDASTVKQIIKTGGNILAGLASRFAGFSTEDTALIWLPQLTKGRLIVIDDIERKHKSLDIDEFLGMLDEYSETHETRFLILLNTDQLLENTEMWATLHEKVIDAEVVLDPTVSESFDIAARGNVSNYLPDVRTTIVILNISNIRVIKRILKITKRVAEAIENVVGVSAARWVPSVALLTACHYRAIENAPPFEYIKSFNQFSHMFDQNDDDKRNPIERDWDLLLNKLGIQFSDAFEEIMQQFLQTGLLDVDSLKELFESYKKEEANSAAMAKQNEFFKAFWWDVNLSEDDLIAIARELLHVINELGPDSISDIVSLVEKLGDVDLARQLLDAWLLSVESRKEYQNMNEVQYDFTLRKYHPEVIKKLNEMKDGQQPPLTLVETISRINENSGWGERERYALRNSTVQLYENVLKEITGYELRGFLSTHLEWARRSSPFDENFKIGTDNFLAACFNIYTSNPNARLSKVIFRTFEANSLTGKLETPPPALTPANTNAG